MQGRQLTLFNFITFWLRPLQGPFRTVYAHFVLAFSAGPDTLSPTSSPAEIRTSYAETVRVNACLAVGVTVAVAIVKVTLGWAPDFSPIGLPETIALPFLPLILFAFFNVWSFFGHAISAAVDAAARLNPVQILACLLADLISRFLPIRLPVQSSLLSRARAAHTLDPAVDLPRSGVPFLLFASTCSLRIP